MESVTSYSSHLKSLQRQAMELASASSSLTALLDEEASRLKRKDEASRLIALHSAIMQQLDWAESMEDVASYRDSDARLTNSLVGLVMGIASKIIWKDKRSSAFSGHLLKNLGGKRRPFGTVRVCIGPRGVPDDVAAASVSGLARESNQEESQVISEMERRGCLLFGERAFSLLMDKLTDDVREGRLFLPISTEILSQIKPSSCLKPVAKKSVWVPVPRPR